MDMEKSQQDNKDKIIEYATKLFYDFGYSNTSFDKIANFCGVTKPLITYHFKTKANLAKEVVEKYNIDNKNNLEIKLYKSFDRYDTRTSTVIELIAFTQMYYEDQKAREFFLEYANSGFENKFLDNTSYYKIHDRHYRLNINKKNDEISMLTIAANFSFASLLYSFFTGKLNCDYLDFLDYTIKIPFKFMNIDMKEIDEIIYKGKKIYEQLDISYMPYFKII